VRKKLDNLKNNLKNRNPEEIIQFVLKEFGIKDIVFSSSLGLEDQVLTDMILKIEPEARIMTLDTGRLFQETYALIQKTMKKYSMKYEIYFPDTAEVEKIVRENGPDLFYEKSEYRKLCCHIRKILPLKRALKDVKAWICGLRQDQSEDRREIDVIEWDENFEIFKINPLYQWSYEDVWKYVREKEVPYNELHDKGFISIGCAPCTRAVCEGEDFRSGRWWWEKGSKKECGLHLNQKTEVKKGGKIWIEYKNLKP